VVPKDETFDLPDDNFYVYEIVGMEVETEDGETVGLVKDVLSIPGNDIYVVDRNGEEVLLPAVKELMTVDRDARKIVVASLEGLV
jgi:16S rRNA processing protein RimM